LLSLRKKEEFHLLVSGRSSYEKDFDGSDYSFSFFDSCEFSEYYKECESKRAAGYPSVNYP
jgi:hypothetical protein